MEQLYGNLNNRREKSIVGRIPFASIHIVVLLITLQLLPLQNITAQNLDLLGLPSTAPSAAFSLRKAISTYTGPAIRVRRNLDNAEVDVAFDGSNEVSASSMVKFIPGITLSNTSSFSALKNGSLNATTGSSAVTGSGTNFTAQLAIGDILVDEFSKTTIGIVASIIDATNLTLTTVAAASSSGTGQFRAAISQSFSTFYAGASCFVQTWYDQSGNGKNAFRALAGDSQPIIVGSGVIQTLNGKPTIIWQTSTQYLNCNTNTNVQTVNAVRNLYDVSLNTNEWQTLFASPASSDFSIRSGYTTTPNANDWVGGTGTPPTNWVNGVQTMKGTTALHALTASASAASNNTFSISSAFYDRGLKNNIGVSELLLFPGVLSTAEKQTLECNQLNYFSIINSLLTIAGQTSTICSASAFSSAPGAANITYTWGTPAISPVGSITGGSAQGSPVSAVSQALTNISGNPATAVYTVTPSLCGKNGTPFSVTVTVNPLPAAPTIAADYCTGDGFVKLTSSAGAGYLWSTGQTSQVINVNNAGIYSVSTSSGVYGCAATTSITVAQELVTNGNFDAGFSGFTTSYTNDQVSTIIEGTFAVRTDAHFTHPSFYGKDHTTGAGNFMIVNGKPAPAGAIVWAQSNIAVQPNTTYYFSAWGLSLTNDNYAILQFSINGFQNGSIAYLPKGYTNNNGPYSWVRFFGQWNSGSSTVANISIVDLNTVLGGNDFGLDDISFGTLSPVALSATPAPNSGAAVCQGGSLYLTANAVGGASPYTYAWSGPNSFTSNVQNPTVTTTAGMVNNGIYQLIITDGFGCQHTATTTVNITALPTDKTPAALVATLCAGGTTSITIPASQTGVRYQLRDAGNMNIGTPVTGDGNTIYLPTGILNTTTTFTVFATNYNTGCGVQMSGSVTVTIAATPVLKIANQAVCAGIPVDLTAAAVTTGSTGGGTLSYWKDAAATIALAAPSNVTISGTYYIQSAVGSCLDIKSVVVSINSTPAAGISYSTPLCNTGINPLPAFTGGGVAGSFSANSAGLVFVSASTGQVNLPASTPGIYTITNTVAAGCTTATASTSITITAIPKANFSYPTSGLCQSINVANQAPVFEPGAVAGSFSSTFGLSFNSTTGVINIGASTPGNYAIWNTIGAANGCPAVADTAFIDVNPYLNNGTVLASASSNNICNGQNVNLYAIPVPYLSALLREKFNSGGLSWATQNNSTGGTPANAAWTIEPNGFDDGSGPFNSNDNSNFYFASSALQGAGGSTAVILKSAAMSTVGFTSLNLDFFHYFKHITNGVANVEVSTDGTNWTAIATFTSTQGTQNAFANATVNLAAYIGLPAFYIRFKYDANFDGCWAIDNVSITGNSSNYTYNWASFPSGFSSTLGNPTGVSPTANSFYILTATNSYGCSQPATPVPVTVLPTQTLAGVSQPSIGCMGSGATINLTGLLPNSTSTISYSINGVAQTPVAGVVANAGGSASFTSSTLSAANNGQQLMITALSNGTCSKSFTLGLTLNIQIQVTWQGVNSSDWFDAGNWCGGIPTSKVSIIIPNSALNFPVLNTGAGAVKDITIQNGASIIVAGGKLSVSGIITNDGSFNATSGTVEFNGTAAQTIAGNIFVANTLKNLTVSNASGLTVSNIPGNLLKITGNLAFGNVDNATLHTSDNIVLVSVATGTARVADITNNGFNTGNKFDGKVTVERYYPASRSWRLVTSPLSNTGNIFNSWQAGAPSAYVPGKGIFVTGPNPSGSTGNGLDYSVFNNYSMKTWNATTSSYINIGNTITQDLSTNAANAANIGYYTFVRGDRRRSPDNTVFGNMNNTTLSSTGFLQTGTQTFNVGNLPNTFPLVGNPYASSVDFNKITKVNINPKRFYVFDPALGTVGLFVVMEEDFANPGSYIPITPNTSSQRNFIQSSQAFFVQTDGSGGPASVIFNENSKSTDYNPNLFRPATPLNQLGSFRTNLLQLNSNNTSLLIDGSLVQFDKNFNDKVDMQDALKFTNINENLGILRYNNSLAVERRPLLKANDTIFLQLTRTIQRSYRFEFMPTNLDPSLTAFLEDSYTSKKIPLNVAVVSTHDFEITADAKSKLSDRFRIVFKQAATGPLPVTYKSIRAYQQAGDIAVEWTVENEMNISAYEVEKSADGVSFVKVNTTTATGANRNSTTYHWLDANPLSGNNFYRIRGISSGGSRFEYSRVVVVRIGKGAAGISLYPNPVTDNIMGLQFKNMPAGVYVIRLTNNLGQALFTTQISRSAGTSMESITPANKLIAGIYQLEVTEPDKRINTIKVIVR